MSSMSTYDSRIVTLLSGLRAINGAMNPPIIAVMASSRRSKTSEIVIMAAVRATSEHIVAKGLISAYMLWAMAIVTKHTANPPPARTDEKLRYESRSRYAMPQRPRPVAMPRRARATSLIQLLSIAYFTKNPTPIINTRIPILLNRFTPI